MQLGRRPKPRAEGMAGAPMAAPTDTQSLVGNAALAQQVIPEREARSPLLGADASDLDVISGPESYTRHEPSTPAAPESERGATQAQSSGASEEGEEAHHDSGGGPGASQDEDASEGGAGASGGSGASTQAYDLATDNGFQLLQELGGGSPSGGLAGVSGAIGFWQGAQQAGSAYEAIHGGDWSKGVDWVGGMSGVVAGTASIYELVGILEAGPVGKVAGALAGGIAIGARGQKYVRDLKLLGENQDGTPRDWTDVASDHAATLDNPLRQANALAGGTLVATLGAAATGIIGYGSDLVAIVETVSEGVAGSGKGSVAGEAPDMADSGIAGDSSGGPALQEEEVFTDPVTGAPDSESAQSGGSASGGNGAATTTSSADAGQSSGGGGHEGRGTGSGDGGATAYVNVTHNDDGSVTLVAWVVAGDGTRTEVNQGASETFTLGADGVWHGDGGGSFSGDKPPEGDLEVGTQPSGSGQEQQDGDTGSGTGNDEDEDEDGDGDGDGDDAEKDSDEEAAPEEEAAEDEEEAAPEEEEGRPSPLDDAVDPGAAPLWMVWEGAGSERRRDDKQVGNERGGGHTDPSPLDEGGASPGSQALALELALSDMGRTEKAIEGGSGGHEGGGKERRAITPPTLVEMKQVEYQIAGGGAVDPSEQGEGGAQGPTPFTPPGGGIAPGPSTSRQPGSRARFGSARRAGMRATAKRR